MVNINRNQTLSQLQNLVTHTINAKLEYMSEQFNKEQQYALELFQKRILLEKLVEETLQFNKAINWDKEMIKNVYLVQSAEELVDVFKLRSDIYSSLNYGKEFPDIIEGLNFDSYDPNSAIIYTKNDKEVMATCRLIFDSDNQLPIEEKLNLENIRTKHKKIAEVSRLMVRNEQKTLSMDFKYLTKGIYMILINNDLDASISVIKKDHFKLYGKFGGFNVERELSSYGHLDDTFVITSWDPKEISKFFEKAFL